MDLYERANMIVAAVPCPPLPMLGTKQVDGEDTVFISHDLLRVTFLNIISYADEEEQRRHVVATAQADAELVEAICAGDDEYASFCTYMRKILQTHTAVCNDIRFKPLDYVAIGDKVHKSTCSHIRGHDHMYKLTGRNYDCMRYRDLIRIYADRLRQCT